MEQQYNLRSPAVKRLMREARELRDPSNQYHAQPLEDNLFEWHFTVAGASDSVFEGGRYHGRIILPSEYPMKPPHIIVLTPNGRFVVGHKICLSVSGYHPETWQPSWSIRTVLLALIGFMPTKGEGAIGALDYTDQERVKLAAQSVNHVCPTCGVKAGTALPEKSEGQSKAHEADEALAAQISFKGAKANATPKDGGESSNPTATSASVDTTSELSDTSNDQATTSASAASKSTGASGLLKSRISTPQSRQRRAGKPKSVSFSSAPPSVHILHQSHACDWVWTILVWVLIVALLGLGVRRLFLL